MLKALVEHIQKTAQPQVEADGGMWKLRARETIKDFLEDELAEELENGQVLIAL